MAPVTVNNVDASVHIVALFTDTVGNELTITVDITVLIQPVVESLPASVYVLLVAGAPLIEFPVNVLPAIVVHVYVFAPEAVNVVVLPIHIVTLFTDTSGKGLTETEAATEEEGQPPEVNPFTV